MFSKNPLFLLSCLVLLLSACQPDKKTTDAPALLDIKYLHTTDSLVLNWLHETEKTPARYPFEVWTAQTVYPYQNILETKEVTRITGYGKAGFEGSPFAIYDSLAVLVLEYQDKNAARDAFERYTGTALLSAIPQQRPRGKYRAIATSYEGDFMLWQDQYVYRLVGKCFRDSHQLSWRNYQRSFIKSMQLKLPVTGLVSDCLTPKYSLYEIKTVDYVD